MRSIVSHKPYCAKSVRPRAKCTCATAAPQFDSCTIQRTVYVRHGKLSLSTGDFVETHAETVTKACGVPLFGKDERARGVCRSCAKGWSVDGNAFATDAERERATNSQKVIV